MSDHPISHSAQSDDIRGIGLIQFCICHSSKSKSIWYSIQSVYSWDIIGRDIRNIWEYQIYSCIYYRLSLKEYSCSIGEIDDILSCKSFISSIRTSSVITRNKKGTTITDRISNEIISHSSLVVYSTGSSV